MREAFHFLHSTPTHFHHIRVHQFRKSSFSTTSQPNQTNNLSSTTHAASASSPPEVSPPRDKPQLAAPDPGRRAFPCPSGGGKLRSRGRGAARACVACVSIRLGRNATAKGGFAQTNARLRSPAPASSFRGREGGTGRLVAF